MNTPEQPVASWKRVVAFIIDFFLSLLLIGGAVAYFTGNFGKQPDGTTGFRLDGLPAVIALAGMVLYFWLGGRYGFRVGSRLLGIRPRRPSPAAPAGNDAR